MRPRTERLFLSPVVPALVLAATLPTFAGGAQAAVGDRRVEEVEATIGFLAGPELRGRVAGSPEGAVASAYVASRLRALGWLPAGDPVEGGGRSYYQAFRCARASYDPAGSWIRTLWRHGEGGGAPVRAAFLHVPDRTKSVDLSGPVVFAGFGIRAPEHRWDDYAGLDVRRKLVLIFSGEPRETDPDSPWRGARPTRHAVTSVKARLAAKLGAAALLIVPNPAGRARSARELVRGRDWAMSHPHLALADAEPGPAVVFLEPGDAGRLLQGADLDLAAASRTLESGGNASRALPGLTAELRLSYLDRRLVTVRNVLARLGTGRGPDGEVVLVGAHWDHLGRTDGGYYPGADDNASGVAGLLLAAESLSTEPPNGGRGVLFASWGGEEEGRLGSTWFVDHPVIPLEKIAVVVNLDELGRNNLDQEDYANVVQVIYPASAPVLRDLVVKANDGVGLDLRFYGGFRFMDVSDHYSFFLKGVPFVFPFSGFHADYHEPTDTPDKVVPEKIVRSARLVARLVRLLAAYPAPIRLDPSIHDAPPPDPFPMPH